MLGDLLPTIYDVAISIFNVASKPKSYKMQQCINAYAESLIDLWIRAFGEDHVLSNKAANQRFDSCEPAIKVGNLYRYTKNNTDPPWPMFYHTGDS